MTSIDAHLASAQSFIEDVVEKMRAELVVKRQKLIGFACSEASCDMFALFLHKKKLIEEGFNINHRFFASHEIARERFAFDFPLRKEMIPLLVQQEKYRNLLCYGKPKEGDIVLACIENMFDIKKIVEKATGEKI